MLWSLTFAGLWIAISTTAWLSSGWFFHPYFHWSWFLAFWGLSAFALHALYTLYLWNFVWLKDLSGPSNASLLFGHMDTMFLAESDSFYHQWEKQYGVAYKVRGICNVLPVRRQSDRTMTDAILWNMHQEPALVTMDPKAIAYVCTNDHIFPRTEATRQVLQTVFPGSIFVAEGEEHRRQKRLVSSAFTPPAVQELSDVLFDLANQMADEWKAGLEASTEAEHIVNVQRSIQVLTTDAISRSALAYSIKDSKGPVQDLLARLSDLEDNLFTVFLQLILNKAPWLAKIPSPVTIRWSRMRKELGFIADDVWEKGVMNKAFHSRLLDAIGQDQRDVCIAQITAILFAGSETTANIIVETIHKLTVFPNIQDKLRKELMDFIEKKGRSIEHVDLLNPTALPYLDAVMKEALRCLASVPHLQRRAAVRTSLPLEFPVRLTNGKLVHEIQVEPGVDIFMPVRDGINTSPDIWGPDAKKFIPERWLDGSIPDTVETIQVPGHILTFGDGPKFCLGRAFAFSEFKIFLSTFLLNFEFLTPKSEDINQIVFHLSGPAVKPTVKGRESEGPALPLAIRLL